MDRGRNARRGHQGETRHRSRHPEEVRLTSEAIEVLAQRIAELVRADRPTAQPGRLMSAVEVAQWCGLDRSWVYAHADELGARRLGGGERPRLRFDPVEVSARIDTLGASGSGPGSRYGPIAGDARRDSLPRRSRASVAEQERAAGRRDNAPGPAPEARLRRDDQPSRGRGSRSPAGDRASLLPTPRHGR